MQALGNLSPLSMMLLSESRTATKLIGKVDRLRERWRATNWGKDLPPAKQRALANSLESAQRDLETLASDVLARQLGLKKYMVVHARREGGYEERFQILAASITVNSYHFVWDLDGRRVRMDGTLGEKPGGMNIDAGTITRRLLDGTWVELHPQYPEED